MDKTRIIRESHANYQYETEDTLNFTNNRRNANKNNICPSQIGKDFFLKPVIPKFSADVGKQPFPLAILRSSNQYVTV